MIHHAVVHKPPPTPRSPALILTYTGHATSLTQLYPSAPPAIPLPLLITRSHFLILRVALLQFHPSPLHLLLPPTLPFPPLKMFISVNNSSEQSVQGKRALSPRLVTLVRGTNCPMPLAYTAGKLRSREGDWVHGVVVCVCVCVTGKEVLVDSRECEEESQ